MKPGIVSARWPTSVNHDVKFRAQRPRPHRPPTRAEKSLGMRDYPGQSGTIRDKTPVFAVVFGRRRGPMGIKTFVPRFPPFGDCRGGVDGFDPWKSVFEGPCCYHHQHNPGHDPGPRLNRHRAGGAAQSPAVQQAARSARYSRTFRRHGVRTAGGRSASASRSDGERTRGPRGVRRGARGGAHAGSRVTHVRGDCPARVPNLGPGGAGAREEAVGEICADAGRGFPRGVSAAAASDDAMTARAFRGAARSPSTGSPTALFPSARTEA